MENNKNDKEMSEIYLNLYSSCIKFQNQKKYKKIDCNKYLENFIFHSTKYMTENEYKK